MNFKHARIVSGVLGIFCVGFGIGLLLQIAYELNVLKAYDWPENSPPIIINCYGDDFSEAQFLRAISYWTIRGEHIGFYEHNPPKEVCEKNLLRKELVRWLCITTTLPKSHSYRFFPDSFSTFSWKMARNHS